MSATLNSTKIANLVEDTTKESLDSKKLIEIAENLQNQVNNYLTEQLTKNNNQNQNSKQVDDAPSKI